MQAARRPATDSLRAASAAAGHADVVGAGALTAAAALAYARQGANRARWIERLREFIALPTVSATPAREPLARGAAWLAAHCRRIGLTRTRIVEGRYPAVVGRYDGEPGAPVVLAYGHYDVQPPGQGWLGNPFAGIVRDGSLYGRGASDDKGQLFMHLAALEALFATQRTPRLNLRLWCEGEEEIGSPGAAAFLDRHLAELRADVVVISDTEMPAPYQPALICGLRGNVVLDVTVHGPRQALHAGRFGGAVANPIEALAMLVASLHDPRGDVAVDGFYRRVRPVSSAERRALAGTIAERTTIRPALVVTSFAGGDDGANIPESARARVTARIVPDQDPVAVARAIVAHLRARTPAGVRCEAAMRAASPAILLPVDAPAMRIAGRALQATFGVPPVMMRSGGSIPIVGELYTRLRAPIVVMGFGLPDDGIHGPNERLRLDQFFRGVETLIRFYAAFAR